jgi:predicted Fe-S protein YdhL (DUF1289 family)
VSGTPPTPPSPCAAICVIDPTTGFCRGCGRTIGEIACWSAFSAEEKWRVLAALPERRRGVQSAY